MSIVNYKKPEVFEHLSNGQIAILQESENQFNAFSAKHFIAHDGGKTRIYRKSEDSNGNISLESWSEGDFLLFYKNINIMFLVNFPEMRLKAYNIAKYWIKSNYRKTYDGILFDPSYKGKQYYNKWDGLCMSPMEGEFPIIEHHFREVWCNGIQNNYVYLTKWFAHLVQHPEQKPGVALVIKGKKGTGKSSIVEKVFTKILGNMYAKIDRHEHIVGHFNAHLQDKLLLVLEEAVWAGDKQAEGAMKSLITEKKMLVEEKGKDAKMVDTFMRLIFISNEKRAVPATMGERRYFALTTSDKYKGDNDYFSNFNKNIDAEIPHFLHYLFKLRFDISDVLFPPHSKTLFEDIYEGMDLFEQWLYDTMNNSCVSDNVFKIFDKTIPTSELYERFENYRENRKKNDRFFKTSRVGSQTKLSQVLKQEYGFIYKKHGNKNSFLFPSEMETKNIYAKFGGCEVLWDTPLIEKTEDFFNEIKPSEHFQNNELYKLFIDANSAA